MIYEKKAVCLSSSQEKVQVEAVVGSVVRAVAYAVDNDLLEAAGDRRTRHRNSGILTCRRPGYRGQLVDFGKGAC